MEPDYYICDKCKTDHVPRQLRIAVHMDRRMDAAGSMTDAFETVDLCHSCAVQSLESFLTSFEDATRLLTIVRKQTPQASPAA